jgi:hypothetical protein
MWLEETNLETAENFQSVFVIRLEYQSLQHWSPLLYRQSCAIVYRSKEGAENDFPEAMKLFKKWKLSPVLCKPPYIHEISTLSEYVDFSTNNFITFKK